jgi:hypothetical protein
VDVSKESVKSNWVSLYIPCHYIMSTRLYKPRRNTARSNGHKVMLTFHERTALAVLERPHVELMTAAPKIAAVEPLDEVRPRHLDTALMLI